MNNDIQMNYGNPPASGDYWTAGQNAVAAPSPVSVSGPAPARSPMKRAHRLLRGRYPLAIVLATVGAVVGAAVGYSLLQPKFQSEAMIQISSQITTPNSVDITMPMYRDYMVSQTSIIGSTRVIEQAIDSKQFKDAWHSAYPGQPLPSEADFGLALDASLVNNSNLIKVSFSSKYKAVAEAGTRATVAAYWQLYGNYLSAERATKINFLSNQQAELNYQLAAKRASMSTLSQTYGTTDLTVQHDASQQELARLQSELSQATIAYETAQAASAGQKNPAVAANSELMVQEIGAVDPEMRSLLLQRSQNQMALDNAAQTYGPRHPSYMAAKARLADATNMVDSYAKNFLIRHNNRIPVSADDPNNPYNLEALKIRVASLKKQVESQKTVAFAVGSTREKIAAIQSQINDLETTLHKNSDQLDALNNIQQLAQNVKIVSPGDEAVVSSDKRKFGAFMGFVLGAAIPISLLMAIGMMDDRFRYSDDATEADLAGVTLLGILPNLPDRLSDPQQAGIAAHCVHQIRTMLQINRSNDEPQVLAVTSAAPADGKTSLTLALGLSYAACGARTLLIDCDLVAAGLTHRLNVSSAEGVLEAVANRALLEFVRTTDIADVAILPVGTTHAHHASTLSPVSLRRLLSEAKKHFDIILVDTGPILGSIEASLVCAAADRTILTVARGQQRPLVERSIGHLQAIGSRLAGVVFNRAQARDFERSMSGLALRSRPMGPMASTASAGGGGTFKRTA